jgi:hypothetical protein
VHYHTHKLYMTGYISYRAGTSICTNTDSRYISISVQSAPPVTGYNLTNELRLSRINRLHTPKINKNYPHKSRVSISTYGKDLFSGNSPDS